MGKQESMTNGQMVLYTDHTTGLEYAGDIGETTPVSWRPRGDLHFEEWIAIGNTLQQVGASLNWWIGDWLNYGERQWGEMFAQATEVTGWDYQRLSSAKWVSGRIMSSLRKDDISWSHHKEVASLEPDEQAKWLERAVTNGWSVRQLREEIRGKPEPLPLIEPPAEEEWTWRFDPSTQAAYCKYCYETHSDWEVSGDHDEPVWTCKRCEHSSADRFLGISELKPESDEVPFNHVTRWGVPETERTPVDDYEQQPDETPTVIYPAETERLVTANGNGMAVHYSSETAEHYTPSVIIDAALACLGEIDLDPCSNSHDTPSIPAAAHYTAEDDGLMQLWAGRVYMNPPYGREIGVWVEKLVREHTHGEVTAAIALVPARTDTQWFAKLRDFPVCFVTGRLTFGGNDDPAPFPSAVFYLGNDIEVFYHSFNHLGDIWQRIEPPMFGE